MNRFAFTCLVGILAGAALGCGSPLSPYERRELEQAEARWAARPFESYSYEIRLGCFCPPTVTEWARVEVVGGTVSRVVLVESGAEVNSGDRAWFKTMEQLFTDIRQASRDEVYDDIVVRFDGDLGFPTSIQYIPKPGVLDAGAHHSLRNARALP